MSGMPVVRSLASFLLAALLLAPGAARAVTECGPLNAGNSFTANCPNAAYANGIVYWNQANAVTLTVPGTATTTTITAPTNTGFDIGIVVGTATHASARNIALTVGGTGTSVDIVQASGPQANLWYRNTGIIVRQRSGGEATTTVDVKSGVTIGTSATGKMNNRGIDVNVEAAGAGAVSVTSGATIHSVNDGIQVENAGAGATTVTNSGAITTDGDGIYARTTGQDGAGANAGVSITHSAGAIAAEGVGIEAHVGRARQETDTEHDDYVTPRNAGLAKVSVTGGSVSSTSTAIRAVNYEAGSVVVEVSDGATLTSTGGSGIEAILTDVGNTAGTVSVTSAGTIKAAKGGINVIRGGGAGTVTIANSGAIEAGDDGIFVVARGGGGAVTVTNSGALGKADAAVARGIFVSHDGEGASGGVTVESSGAITATDHGILAQVKGQDVANANVGVSVTHSAGAIVVASDEAIDDGAQGVKEGIVVRVGNHRAETDADHADYVRPVNAGLAKAAVTGGSVTSKGNAVEVANYEAGGVEIDVSAGVTLTSTHDHGIEADLRDVGNKRGTIKVVQGGAVEAAKSGLTAAVAWAGGAGPDRAIDVTWTGTFTTRESERAPIANIARAVPAVRQQAVNDLDIHYTQGYAGIAAGVMKWPIFMDVVARSDDPGAFADKAAQDALFAADADAATKARAAAIVAQFKAVLDNEDLGTIPGADDVDADGDGSYSDAEITAYLSADDAARRALLRNVLAQSLTDKEAEVLRAVLSGDDVDAALNDAEAGFSEAYKTAVKALVDNEGLHQGHNTGDIRVAVDGGSIDSSGDGVRAWYARPHAMNGAIEVVVAAGATVKGGVAGIYVANAGTGLEIARKYLPPDDLDEENRGPRNLDLDEVVTLDTYRNQVVRVDGTVIGGTDAAVHLDGGGALIVGRTGKLVAGAGKPAVLVNDPAPAVVYIDGEATGSEGADAAVHLTGGGTVVVGLTGQVRANDADFAIRLDRPEGDATPTAVVVHAESGRAARFTQESVGAALMRIAGGVTVTGAGAGIVGDRAVVQVVETTTVNGREVTTGYVLDGGAPLDAQGNPTVPAELPPEAFRCDLAGDERCRLYEALPSALLAMNGLPSRAERMSAAHDGAGGWALVEASGGKWRARNATHANLSYKHSRYGVRVGVDMAAGEDARLGLSAHGLRGSAKTPSSGEAKLSGIGFGVHAAAMLGDGVHLDAQAAATWYDVDVDAPLARKDDAKGRGHAASLELTRRVVVSEDMTVVPRAGLAWSSATLGSFDEVTKNNDLAGATVTVRGATSLTGTVGVAVETVVAEGARMFGSIDVVQEFSGDTEAAVSGTALKSTAKTTTVRAGVGGMVDLGDGAALRGSASYAIGGRGNDEFGGTVSLAVQF